MGVALEHAVARGEQLLVFEPPGPAALERDEVLDRRHLAAHAVDRIQIVRVHAQDLGAAVVREVDEVVGDQAVIHGHDDRAQLRHRVILLEVLMRVRRQRCHAIALLHAELRQCR